MIGVKNLGYDIQDGLNKLFSLSANYTVLCTNYLLLVGLECSFATYMSYLTTLGVKKNIIKHMMNVFQNNNL